MIDSSAQPERPDDDESSGVHDIRSRAAAELESAEPKRTTVRFIDGDGGCSLLEVETSDRSGFVRGLSQALIHESVQILKAEVRRVGSGVQNRFVIADDDGSPIGPTKRLALQVAVLSAVDSDA